MIVIALIVLAVAACAAGSAYSILNLGNSGKTILDSEAFDKLCTSLLSDPWHQDEYYMKRMDGLRIWTANGMSHWAIEDLGIGFSVPQKLRLRKYIRHAASAAAKSQFEFRPSMRNSL